MLGHNYKLVLVEFYLLVFILSFCNYLVKKMSFPSEKTLKKWKEEFGWLRIMENQKMIALYVVQKKI